MKTTTIKIFLLVLLSVGAVAGVFMFAKKQASPPYNIGKINQYKQALSQDCQSMTGISDFDTMRNKYIATEDKITRFYVENAIDAEESDDFKLKINATYGKSLISHGYSIFSKSIWQDNDITQLISELDNLSSDKLESGKSAVTSEFKRESNNLHQIVKDYREAQRLSRNTKFTTINDASNRIQKARRYASADYLRNNISLVNALEDLQFRIADSHYNHLKGYIYQLNQYENMSKEDYIELINRAEKAYKEYDETLIYGSCKKSNKDLEERVYEIIEYAADYYNNKKNYY